MVHNREDTRSQFRQGQSYTYEEYTESEGDIASDYEARYTGFGTVK